MSLVTPPTTTDLQTAALRYGNPFPAAWPRMGLAESTVAISGLAFSGFDYSAKIGYLRAGATVVRGDKPVALDDCQGGYFRVLPAGYVCAAEEATIDLKHPILRALTRRPDLSKPMPYPYAFVRAIAPNYYRVPTKKEQLQYEMKLKEHLKSYKRLQKKWDAITVGANDVPLDEKGNAVGEPPAEPPARSDNEIFGGNGDDAIPWFFQGGRKIPNISSFKAPDYAVITNRIARHAGIAPIPVWSGNTAGRVRLTRSGNRQLNAAIHRIAVTQIRMDGLGKTYYEKKKAEGMSTPEALRCLKRRLARIVYNHLITEQTASTTPTPAAA